MGSGKSLQKGRFDRTTDYIRVGMRDALSEIVRECFGRRFSVIDREEVIETMKAILAAIFAVMVGVTFVGTTFAQDKQTAPPASAPAAGGEMKKEEGKAETKKAKKNKKHHKETAKKDEGMKKDETMKDGMEKK